MESVIIKFPLRGEWVAAHTPAEKIPSHGTDLWGQTYAYDFLRIAWNEAGFKFFSSSNFKYWVTGIGLDECYGYGEPIYSPFSGVVVESHDGSPERQCLHPIVDYLSVLKNALMFEQGKERGNSELVPMLGNYMILKESERDIYALFAHLRPGSLRVRNNDMVSTGDELAQVGHTGNSTAPHLHFQLMDSVDLRTAKGVPCSFEGYESFENGSWREASGEMPEKRQLIRQSPNTAPQPTSGRDAAAWSLHLRR